MESVKPAVIHTSDENTQYQVLLQQVGETLERGRSRAAAAVKSVIVATYW